MPCHAISPCDPGSGASLDIPNIGALSLWYICRSACETRCWWPMGNLTSTGPLEHGWRFLAHHCWGRVPLPLRKPDSNARAIKHAGAMTAGFVICVDSKCVNCPDGVVGLLSGGANCVLQMALPSISMLQSATYKALQHIQHMP